jgi:hypothetical protein
MTYSGLVKAVVCGNEIHIGTVGTRTMHSRIIPIPGDRIADVRKAMEWIQDAYHV